MKRRVILGLGLGLILSAMSIKAFADIKNINPPAGLVAPGGSTTAQVNVDNQYPAESCLITRNDPSGISVSFTPSVDPPNNCQKPPFTANMKVSAEPSTPPGSYLIHVFQCGDVNSDGQFCAPDDPPIHQADWPLTVQSASSSTTTTTTTTTLPPGVQNFTVSCAPSDLEAQPGQTAPSTCTVKSQNGFNSPVSLSCDDQPVATACGFKPLKVTPPPNGSVNSALTVNVLEDAEPGEFDFLVVGTSEKIKRTARIKLLISAIPEPTPTEIPEGPVVTQAGGKKLELDRASTEPGGDATASGKGCDSNSPVEVTIQNKPAGKGTADADGEFEIPIKIPDDVGVGRHQVIAECGPTIETVIDVVVFARSESPGAPMAVLAVLFFFILEARRLLRREGAITPRR